MERENVISATAALYVVGTGTDGHPPLFGHGHVCSNSMFDTNLDIHLVVRKDLHDSMNLGSCRTSVPVQHILYVQKKNGIVAYMFLTNESC